MYNIGNGVNSKKEKSVQKFSKRKKKTTYTGLCNKSKYIFCAGCVLGAILFMAILSIIMMAVLLYTQNQEEIIKLVVELARTKSFCCLQETHITWNVNINIYNNIMIDHEKIMEEVAKAYAFNRQKDNHVDETSYTSEYQSENVSSSKFSNYEVAPVIRVVSNFSEMSKNKERFVIIGDPFLVFEGGYQILFSICPSGCYTGNGEDAYLSVYLHLMKGPYDDELEQTGRWPLRGVFKIELLNQFSDECNYGCHYLLDETVCSDCVNRVEVENEASYEFGYDRFRLISGLNTTVYFQNDSLYFRISYEEYFSMFAATELMADTLNILKLNVFNWVFVTVVLIFIEFIRFCCNEIIQRPRIVNEEFGFGTAIRFLFTNRPWYTGYTVLCRTIRNILLIVALTVIFFVLIVAAEFAYPDFSTLTERYQVIIRMMQTGRQVVMLSMCIDIYETSCGKKFPIVAPFWIMYLFPVNMFVIKSFIYNNWFEVCIIMYFCSELYKMVTNNTYTLSMYVAFYVFIFIYRLH